MDPRWTQQRTPPHAGVTLEDLRIRQEVLAPLALPLELTEGRVARLHVSGDWSLSQGLRPRLAMSGVVVRARLRPPPPGAAPPPPPPQQDGGGGSSLRAAALRALPAGTALRQLLKRIRVDIEGVDIAVVDSVDAATAAPQSPRAALRPLPRVSRAATLGFTVQRVTTEGTDGAAGASAASGESGAFQRRITLDFGGAFWIPQAIACMHQAGPAALFAPEDTRQWTVVHPVTAQVRPSRPQCFGMHRQASQHSGVLPIALYTTLSVRLLLRGVLATQMRFAQRHGRGQLLAAHTQMRVDVSQGAGRQQRVSIEASISHVPVALSPWQVADVLRVQASIGALQRRARYAHLRPPGMDTLLGHGAAPADVDAHAWQTPLRLAHEDAPVATWSQVWRYATLAVRADRRARACIAAARGSRARRFLQHYSEYLGACTLLYAARAAQGKSGGSGGGKGAAGDAAAWAASGEECDPQFFAWLLAQTLQRAHADASGGDDAAAEPLTARDSASAAHDEADAAAAAVAAAHEPRACGVSLVATDDHDAALRLRVAMRSAPPTASAATAEEARSSPSSGSAGVASGEEGDGAEPADVGQGSLTASKGSEGLASSLETTVEIPLAALVQVLPPCCRTEASSSEKEQCQRWACAVRCVGLAGLVA